MGQIYLLVEGVRLWNEGEKFLTARGFSRIELTTGSTTSSDGHRRQAGQPPERRQRECTMTKLWAILAGIGVPVPW